MSVPTSKFRNLEPRLGHDVLIAPGVRLVGDVEIHDGASVWFNSVLRGDINRVRIGEGTNIQDLTVCHVADDWPCEIGDWVTVGHSAILHGCRIGDEVLIGMGATLMNGVVVGPQSIIGARALITENTHVPAGSLVYGSPAKIVSKLGNKEREGIRDWAEKYRRLAAAYIRQDA